MKKPINTPINPNRKALLDNFVLVFLRAIAEITKPDAAPGSENKWPSPSSPSGRELDQFIYKYARKVIAIPIAAPVWKKGVGLKNEAIQIVMKNTAK